MAPRISPKLLAAGGAVYIGMSTATYLYLRSTKGPVGGACPCPSTSTPAAPSAAAFDRLASGYDKQIDLDETLMGVKLLRRWLLRQASGDVLEVAAGTGRNLKYYSGSGAVRSLTLTDASREMLMRAAEKVEDSGYEKKKGYKVSFALADVEELCKKTSSGGGGGGSGVEKTEGGKEGPEEEQTRYGPTLRTVRRLQPGSYDTVVDTFGLCSCGDPVAALRGMAAALRPGGRLLLLEHGKGTWDFINGVLDRGADAHLTKWGCQWNRDITAAVEAAGLEVESVSRWHFGTTYMIVARPSKGAQREGERAV